MEAVIAATDAGTGNRLDLLATAARQAIGQAAGVVDVPANLRQSGDLDVILLVRALSLPAR